MWTVMQSRSANAGKRGRAEHCYQAESGLQLFKIKLQPAVATALWAVVKSTAEIDRPQAGGYNISQTALNLGSFESEKAIDEIGERARILGHESVTTTRELGQPRAGNSVDELQRIRRRNDDVLTAGGD